MKKLTSYLASIAVFSCIGFSAVGDDLDIYLGSSSSTVTYKPNVLFIMDTSGSMGSQDGTGKSRLLRVQEALKEALDGATNINAGLMRFSDDGGPVLFPVRDIDSPINAALVATITDGNDDAYEVSGSVSLDANTLLLSDGTNTVTTGLRFSDVPVPQGATITSAKLRFTSEEFDISSTTLTISAEADASSAAFTDSSSNLSSRTKTSSQVEWAGDNTFPEYGELILSPDISSVIQEVVDQTDWCGGNKLNILIEGVSTSAAASREAWAFDAGLGAPQLVVEYDDATATGCMLGDYVYQVASQDENYEEDNSGNGNTGNRLDFSSYRNNYIGVRFNDVKIAQGAEIEEAYIEFTARGGWSGTASSRIRVVNEDDARSLHYRSSDENNLRDLPKTGSITWSMPAFTDNFAYRTPDISSLVKTIVDKPGWNAGNNMAFVFDSFSGERGVESYQGSPGDAAKLIVKFRGNAVPGASSTVRQHIKSKVDELSANGWTPIVDTLYEAASYYGGLPVYYGLQRGSSSVPSNVRQPTRVSHRDSYVGLDSVLPSGCSADNLSSEACEDEYIPSGARYVSPVTDLQCQVNNHIVLLSDGVANNNHSVDEIESLLGTSCDTDGLTFGEQCGIDLVRNISSTDTSVIGPKVITHTIGFASSSSADSYLTKLATQSGGGFYPADDSTQLLEAFKSILSSVKKVNTTFVAPGVAVNQLNRLTHNDELYFALFKPSEGALWPGNLKRYRLDGQVIVDKNDDVAVDSDTGYFDEGSHSYWSTLEDGNDVAMGGAASKMSVSRDVYFFDGPGAIKSTANAIHEDNVLITPVDLGIDSVTDAVALREAYLKWARGVDVKDSDGDGDNTDVRLQMGDPIHSQPIIVDYGSESVIFIATNHGMLHAFDSETGEELYGVMPKSLLSNIGDFYDNISTRDHTYGLDGDLVLRTDGSNKYLYVGMRRGGRNYYVFDITNKTSPSLKFMIEGGTTGLEKLGQSWSRPIFTKVKIGATDKNVMIIGGGYDEDQDGRVVRGSDAVGNAVFMFDANTGALLWKASNTDANLNIADMEYSIPARISVIDRDNDGYADHMYVTDTGGQLFRLDIYNGESVSNLVKGQLIADFNGDTAETNRRFYYAPDVTEIALADELYYAVAIGSGWRASPLDTVVNDNFYMVKDEGVFKRDSDGKFTFPLATITESDLFNATNHALTSDDSSERELAAAEFANKDGWFINMSTGGEKILGSPLIIDYKVFFTSYVPAVSSESACAPPTGNSRAYLVSMFNGNAVADINRNNVVDANDRSAELNQTGIAPDARILIQDITNPVVCLGTECASAVITDTEEPDPDAPPGTTPPSTCVGQFACLAENIFGRFERIKRGSWNSSTERE